MLKRFQDYVENEPWDDLLDRDGRLLRRVCWGVLIVAAVYLGGVMIAVLLQGPAL